MKPSKQIVAYLSSMILTFSTASGAAKPDIPDEVKDHIRMRVDQGGTAGIIVGVVGEGGTSFFAHGVASQGGPKLDEDTVFEIGSITKAFTALLLADAVIEGKVKLDDPAAKYLPSSVKVPARGDKVITLEHLATHRSGLPRLPDNFEPADENDPYADYTVERLYAFLSGASLSRDPGAEYEYSNLAAGLLGHLLGQSAGKNYAKLVGDRICRPLGLKDTACDLNAAMRKRLAQGHSQGKPAANWNLQDSLAGAGAIRSTTRDMTKFIAACLGLSNDKLKPVMAKCLEVRYPTGMPDMDVALGWHVDKKGGAEAVWHNGGTGGYHSFCGFRPDKRIGVVVLTNTDDNIDDIGRHLLKPESPLEAVRSVVAVDEATLNDYVGHYQFAPGMLLQVAHEGSGLQAQLTGQSMVPIFAEAKDKFFYKVVDAQLTFVRDDAGKVSKVILHQNGRDQTAERLPPDKAPKPRTEVKVAPEVLKSYAGKYQLAPSVTFDVRQDGEKLMVQLTGQQRFQVFPESEIKFFYKVVDAQLTFVREADGKVGSLILHQGGRDQTAKRVEE